MTPPDPDAVRRLKSVVKTLEESSKHGFIPIEFAQLAHDIRELLAFVEEASK